MSKITSDGMEWTGMGCDVCGYGTIEDLDKFDPQKPCPECGTIMWVSREGAEGR